MATPSVPLLVLLVAVCASHASAFTVCVIALPGMGSDRNIPFCNAKSTLADDPGQSHFIGIEAEMFRSVATRAGWTFDPTPDGFAAPFASKRFGFRCLASADFSTQLKPLLGDNSCSSSACNTTNVCHGVFGTMLQSTIQMASSGYKVSQPLRGISNSILVYDDAKQPVDLMAFIKPLDWKLWLVFVATVVILPFAIWTIEKLSTEGYIPLNHSSAIDLRFAVYRNILTMFNQDIMFVTTTGAQLTMITFLFLTFVVISTYTASLAAFLTVSTSSTTANDLRDFKGKPVYVFNTAAQFVRDAYGMTEFNDTRGGPTSLVADVMDVFHALKQHKLAAAFLPRTLIETVRAQVHDCKFHTVGRDVESLIYATYFHRAMPDAMMDAIDASILLIKDQGLYSILDDSVNVITICNDNDAAEKISYTQMFGLFLILYGTVGAALLYTVFLFIRNKMTGKVADSFGKEQTAEDTGAVAVQGMSKGDAPGAYDSAFSQETRPKPPTSTNGNPRPKPAQSSLKV